MEKAQGEITLLLLKWKNGEREAFDELLPLVYPHLREVAAAYIRKERDAGLMQATVLVHELYLRLLNQRKSSLEDRSHFYTFAAMVMRRILIDHARGHHAQRRGGGMQQVPLNPDLPWIDVNGNDMLQFDIALDELQAIDPIKVRLVELRYFLGCTSDEAASLMNISKATVDRDVKLAKAWLYRRVHPEAVGPPSVA